MKKTNIRRTALLLVIALLAMLLSGCAAARPGADDGRASRTVELPQRLDYSGEDYIDMVSFPEMEYVRPDLDGDLARIDALIAALAEREDSGMDLRRTARELSSIYAAYYTYDTMMTLAEIRHDLNTADPYYDEEYTYCASGRIELGEKFEELFAACAGSAQADSLSEFFGEGFLDEYDADYVYPEAYIALSRRENELEQQYHSALTDAHVTYEGRDYTRSELYRAARSGALGALTPSEALDLYYDAVNPELGGIYVELVKVRQQLAAERGYDSYIDMAYSANGRDYGPEDVQAYTAAIVERLVPLYRRAVAEGLADSANDTTPMKARRCLQAVTAAANAMGGEIADAMEYLLAYELCDVDSSDTKYADSYEIYLEDYESPFFLVNSIGYSEDTLTIAHEFGHFTDDYVNYGIGKSTDVNETISQGMEYLTLCYLEDDALRAELTAYKLMDTLQLYAEQGSYNAFEERVYALPADEVTLENINAISLQVSQEYGVDGRWSDDYYAKSWIEITHFYDMPFYLVSYFVSDSAAVQLYEMELETPGSGLAMYGDYIDLATEEEFMDIAADCGLRNPISAAQIAALAETLEQQLF